MRALHAALASLTLVGPVQAASPGETHSSVDSAAANTPLVAVDSLRIAVEPGFLTGAGKAVLPVRLSAMTGPWRRVEDSALALEIEGVRGTSFEVVSVPLDLSLLIDPSSIPLAEREDWVSALSSLATAKPGDAIRFWMCGDQVEAISDAKTLGESFKGVDDNDGARLFDGVVEVASRLAGTAPASSRHVLLLVGSGDESKESRHPVVSAADAADSARLAVYPLLVAGEGATSAGEARLRELATRTGGVLRRASPNAASSSIEAALARIREVQSLQFALPEGASGRSRMNCRVLVPDAAPQLAIVGPRVSIPFERGNRIPWLPITLGTLLVAGGGLGGVLWRRPVGYLEISRGAPSKTIPILRQGITLGGAQGNQLVLEDSRISRNHAVIRVRGREATLVDLRSTNGTFVNGKPISTKVLRPGDRILLAEAVELVYQGHSWRGLGSQPASSHGRGQSTRKPQPERLAPGDDEGDE